MEHRALGRRGLRVSRLGVGLAAVGRPGYITLGRARDLGARRDPDALFARTADVLDAARAAGVRYVDAARSYGRAEEFLARWLGARRLAPDAVTVGSKWGYAYTAGWRVDAPVHEQKELTLARFRTQLAESRALLGDRLALYQIHSATIDSGVFADDALLAALVDERTKGSYAAVGLTLSGLSSAAALRAAMAARSSGEPVFDVVQATFNLLEPSLAPFLRDAHAAGLGIIAKEVHANGRLTPADDRPEDAPLRQTLHATATSAGMTVDQLALAWVLSHDFVDVALSGAATVAQLHSHASATTARLPAAATSTLAALSEPPATYWHTRSTLRWT
jgi:aryl-alcohol dehydrogenase-like predicted oxidoreductase